MKPIEDFEIEKSQQKIEGGGNNEKEKLKERNTSMPLVLIADSRQDAIQENNPVKRSASEANESTFLGS